MDTCRAAARSGRRKKVGPRAESTITSCVGWQGLSAVDTKIYLNIETVGWPPDANTRRSNGLARLTEPLVLACATRVPARGDDPLREGAAGRLEGWVAKRSNDEWWVGPLPHQRLVCYRLCRSSPEVRFVRLEAGNPSNGGREVDAARRNCRKRGTRISEIR